MLVSSPSLRVPFAVAAAIGLLGGSPAAAQRPLGSERGDIAHLAGDVWAVGALPLHADGRATFRRWPR